MFKILKKSFWSAIITFILIFIIYAMVKDFSENKEPQWGVTFSSLYASELGLDPKVVYDAVLDDLKIKNLRLVVYWPQVEPQPGQFDFSKVDEQIIKASQHQAQVILVVGQRVPRWPECHIPIWAKELNKEDFKKSTDLLIAKSIEHFRVYSNIVAWQVNNEPFLESFGKCEVLTPSDIAAQIEIIRQTDDRQRPIMLTESGELSTWIKSARLADIIGTSLYRTVWNKYFGYWHYPWPPAYYKWHADLITKFFPVKKVIISELQAEPWPPGHNITELDLEEQFKSFNLKELIKNVDYVRRTGMSPVYFWGVEWWYWLKVKYDHPEFWEYVRILNNN